MLTNLLKFTLTFVSLIPTSSSPDSRVPSLAAGVLSNTCVKKMINCENKRQEVRLSQIEKYNVNERLSTLGSYDNECNRDGRTATPSNTSRSNPRI